MTEADRNWNANRYSRHRNFDNENYGRNRTYSPNESQGFRPSSNRNFGHRGFNSSNAGHRRWDNITPNNSNRPNQFCSNNNNVTNLSFNEDDFMSSTAYKTSQSKRRRPRPRFYPIDRYNSSFNNTNSRYRCDTRDKNRNPSFNEIINKDKIVEKDKESVIKKNEISRKEPLKEKRKPCTSKEKVYQAVRKQKEPIKPIAIKKPCIDTNRKLKDKENLGKDANNFICSFIIDAQGATGNDVDERPTQSKYVCNKNLKFPSIRTESLGIESPKERIQELPKKLTTPKKITNASSVKSVTNTVVKKVKEDDNILGDEFEICQSNSSIINGSLNIDNIFSNNIFVSDLSPTKNKDAAMKRDKKPCLSPTKIMTHPSQSSIEAMPPPKQSPIKAVVPSTQIESLTPSLGIPCGQQIKMVGKECITSKPEDDDNVDEHFLTFFSQPSPLILSQVNEPQMTTNAVNFYSDICESIPSKVADFDIDSPQSILPSQIKSVPNTVIANITNKSSNCSGQSEVVHLDGDIIPNSQIDIASSLVPDINNLRNLSKNNSLDSTFNKSVNNLEVEPYFKEPILSNLDSSNLPITSTQNCRKTKQICLPDISPLTVDRHIPVINIDCDGSNKIVVQECWEAQQNLVTKPYERQEIGTQSFRVDQDNMLSINPVGNNSVMDDSLMNFSGTCDFDAIKLKMEPLFDVPVSQCLLDLSSCENSPLHCGDRSENLVGNKSQENLSECKDTSTELGKSNDNHSNYEEFQQEQTSIDKENQETDVDDETEEMEKSVNESSETESTELDESTEIDNKEIKFAGKENTVHKGSINKIKKAKNKAMKRSADKEWEDNEINVNNGNEIQKQAIKKRKKIKDKDTDLEKETRKQYLKKDDPCKKNLNPEERLNIYIEEYDAKVEDVIKGFRDLCENKKRIFMKYKTATRFEVKIQDFEGTGTRKEKIEFFLRDDEKGETVANNISISMKFKSGNWDQQLTNSQPFNVIDSVSKIDDKEKENMKKCIKIKKKGKAKSDASIVNDHWWEDLTEGIPSSIFRPSKESTETSSTATTLKTLRIESLDNNPKIRKLSENTDLEFNTDVVKKKSKKSKKEMNKLIVEDICDVQSETKTCAPQIEVINSEVIPEEITNKKKKKKSKKKKQKKISEEQVECYGVESLPRTNQETKTIDRELGKTLNKFYKKNKELTPPFLFARPSFQPGKKRHLLNNFDQDWLES